VAQVTAVDMWLTFGLAVAAIFIAIGALFIAHTWKLLVEDLVGRMDRLERELGVKPKLPKAQADE
jgi:hypothetical protein